MLASPELLRDLNLSDTSSPATEQEADALGIDVSSEGQSTTMYSYPDKAAIWLSKFRGETHWAVYIKEFKSIFSSDGRLEFPPLPQIHPGADDSPDGASNLSHLLNDPKGYILLIIPDREQIRVYVESYLSTVERIYRILHIPSFREEAEAFWTNEQLPRWDWLAQYLLVIGIGCLTTPNASIKEVARLLRAAEVCLLQISLILNPTILTINALCMMVIAKHVGAMSCHEYDSCSPLMGVVIRQAMSLGLHCDPTFDTKETSPFQTEMRRRLWMTIVHLELRQSITSGMAPLLKNGDFSTLPPSNLNDDDLDLLSKDGCVPAPEFEITDSSFQILLASSFSAAHEIVNAANSLSETLSYERVTCLDSRIRELLAEASFIRSNLSSSEPNWKVLQISTLQLTFRRILLTLHQRYARQPEASVRYPTSYWSALESALAILVHQRQIHEDPDHHESAKWFAELFKNDFFMAIMMVGIQLCRKDNSALDGREHMVKSSGGYAPVISPRSTILQTLKWCEDIWTSRLTPSFCQSKVSEIIGRIIRSVELEN
ncbi:hypothetical protein PRK78_003967 [Emydomyces testavorans]|uniref:Xylanolytic transcriptional activator regulatory domain-containing protein n=1 Tax=Emydomyces testavorans TaxID=2070801 RepID=A0AAF0IL43_9EURO|nr:hypothetical protein PRK78_003967 [Emydomyces testavorans]